MIEYRLATSKDNQQLIELTADSGMDGDIALRIDRNPDFFTLTELRGESRIYLAEENNKIIGSLCVSQQHVYVKGELVPVHYIGDFKVATAHRNRGVGLELTNTVANYLIDNNADLVFLNVSKGNAKPFSFFTNRNVGTDFESVGTFHIYQFIGKKKVSIRNYDIETTEITEEVVHFIDHHHRNYALGNHVTQEKLEGTELYVIRESDTLVAAMCLMDTMDIKQNIVTGVSWKMNLALKCVNNMSSLLGISKMPVLHQPVSMLYIKYLAYNKNESGMIRALIDYARTIVYNKGYSFASIGVHEKDPINSSLGGMIKFTFKSVGMLSSIHKSTDLVNAIKTGIPFEDYSLV